MAPFMLLLFLLSPVVSGSEKLEKKPGDDVTLNCSAGGGYGSIRAVKWTRSDLSPGYVLFYSDKQLKSPFEGRVDLADRELKDGNVSLVLKNVSSNDSGTYECRVAKGGLSRRKRANTDITDLKTIRTIQLEVTASGTNSKYTMDGDYEDTTNRDGNKHVGLTVGLPVGLPVVGLICSAVVVVGMFLWKKRRHTDSKSEPAADKAVGDQLL